MFIFIPYERGKEREREKEVSITSNTWFQAAENKCNTRLMCLAEKH